jgi:hypothetical protein
VKEEVGDKDPKGKKRSCREMLEESSHESDQR